MAPIIRLFIITFIGGLYFYLPVFTLFLLNHEVTLATIVFAQVSYSVTSFLAEVPTGILADRIGQQHSVALGYFMDVIGLTLIVLFPGAAMLIVAQGMRGISGALMSGSKEALLYEYTQKAKRNYKRDYSHMTSYEVLGFACSTLFAGVLIQLFGQASYVPIFFLTIIAVLVAGLISLTLPNISKGADTGKGMFRELKQVLRLFRTTRMLPVLFLVIGLTYDGKYILLETYQPHLQTAQVIPFLLGGALAVGNLANYFFLRHAYKLEKPFGARGSLLLLASLTGLLYIVFGMFTDPYVTAGSFVLLFGILGTVSVFISDYANQHTPSHIRATVLSAISFSKEIFKTFYKIAFGVAVGVLALGHVFALYGVLLLIGAGVSYWLLTRVSKQELRLTDSHFNSPDSN